MKATKMREMMTVASLLVAACGSSGDGGADAGQTATCSTGAECDSGHACDLTTHECVSGALTIEPTDEVVVSGTRWWTTVRDPLVRGTFDGPSSSTIEVTVGTTTVTATLQGTTWSAKLPADSIASDGTVVQVMLSEPTGRTLELAQLFQLDAVEPQIRLASSKLRDERGDTIDFSTGEPVHAHVGAELDLAAGGCPSVYKYAYLMDAQDPPFGRETTQNPLAWSFEIHDVNVATVRYRVRDANDQVLVEWTPLQVANGRYRVELLRSDVPALGSYTGRLRVDVLARDWTGRDATSTVCIDYHPLAAPLQIESAQPANTTWDGTPSLFSMSLPADSPVSLLTGTGNGPAIATQRVVQYASEPIALTSFVSPGAMRYARTYVDDYVVTATMPLSNTTCDEIDCITSIPTDPADSTASGVLSSFRWGTFLVDEATNKRIAVLGTPTIPPRGANEPPHAYRVIAYLAEVVELRPKDSSVPAEYTVNNLTYTGLDPSGPATRCTATEERCKMGVCVQFCTESTTFQRIVALDRASLEIDGVTFDLRTSTSSTLGGITPPHVPPTAFTVGPLTWDAGDDDLPGPN